MRLLLDTHALLWWLSADSQLARRSNEAIGDDDSAVYVSAASAWEIATKARLGKLPGTESLAQDFEAEIKQHGFLPLSISVEHGQRAGSLPGPHKDPFDRMLIAQAQAENLVLVSNEAVFDQYGVTRLWD
ncbi:MAG TPA: type II toxin-antitoxin system VapC family toxin [Longimicrobium sp.]|nr:type II toxin-antitoxin system VapC family toxin [Longimicrobium sp.]